MNTTQFPAFDRSRLRLRPLSERTHDMSLAETMDLEFPGVAAEPFATVGRAMRQARRDGASVILMMGAHVIRAGTQRFLIDLMEQGLITCLAVNGAGVIHDFELALGGATTESVREYLRDGRFGLWNETGTINDIVSRAAADNDGIGSAMGRFIEEAGLPHQDLSVLAAAHRFGVLATCHSCIGQDIVHEHPNCDGAAWGKASYLDFLRFAAQVERMEGGVCLNLGSAVMGPEVFLKALAMARNVAATEGRAIDRFTTLVTDLADLPPDSSVEPPKSDHRYYFRPWKTLLSRSVASGGTSHYAQAPHRVSVPQIWAAATGRP